MPLRTLLSTLPAPARSFAVRSRLVLATLGAAGAAVLMRAWHGSIPAALWIPTGLLAVSALLLHHGQAGSQLVARSAWWANLVLGTIISLMENGSDRWVAAALVFATGLSLFAMGRLGLDEDESSLFRPVAFRGALTLGMIMAVADAQALAFFGALKLQQGGWKESASERLPQIVLLLVSAALLVLAIAGLYRLRLWGLLLATACAAGVAALAFAGAYGLPSPLDLGLVLTSAVQVLLPVPLLVAIVRGRPSPPSKAASTVARLVPGVLVAAMMAASGLAYAFHIPRVGW